MERARIGSVVLALALLGCAEGTTLAVDLKTDFIPTVDFIGTRVTVVDTELPPVSEFAFGGDILEGHRVAELLDVPLGNHLVSVELLDDRGLVVHDQQLSVQLDGPTAVTMLVTRSCQGIFCEDGLTCVGGACVDPSCSEEGADCEGACTDASECEGDTGECMGFACISNFCFVDISSGCSEEQWCHPDDGCVARDTAGEPVLTLVVRGQGRIQYGPDLFCGPEATCEIGGERGTLLTLNAEPATDPFWGWAGEGCDDREAPCEVTLDGPSRVVAVYGPSRRTVDSFETVDELGEDVSVRYNGLLARADGSVLVADAEADRIWEVLPTGTVRSFAGTGFAGYEDGDVSTATFTNPTDLTQDTMGNVYVADNGNNRIRRIDATGMVTTYAGSGEGIAMDGDLLTAGLPNPEYIEWRETDQVLLVVSAGLRMIGASTVSTIDVDVGGRNDIGVDAAGNVYWSTGSGMFRLPMGSAQAELLDPSPCDRSGGWSFRLTAAPDGTIVESVGGGWICRRDPDGTTTWPILPGGSRDGADFEARSSLAGSALELADDGTLFFTDSWPGRRLRAIRPP